VKKTKKQHYVPRCYLENFSIPDTYKINVYDKKSKFSRVNSINDVASENYFYDVKFSDVLTEDLINELKNIGVSIDTLDNEQYIEHYMSEAIEGTFSTILRDIISKVKSITPWYINNCFFISEEQKMNLSICLAVQYVRTKSVREGILESSDCMLQLLDDINANQELKNSMIISQENLKLIHGKMIFDKENIFHLASSFYSLKWVLGINKTSKHFYTSDSPIGTKAHINHPFLSMNGLDSPGVEAFFPMSPEIILVMYDGEYHKEIVDKDRTYWIITEEDNVDYYNSLSVMRSHRCIFSDKNDFSLIEKMILRNPLIFENNESTELHYGGKVYRPQM
jgi:hypothetical protein